MYKQNSVSSNAGSGGPFVLFRWKMRAFSSAQINHTDLDNRTMKQCLKIIPCIWQYEHLKRLQWGTEQIRYSQQSRLVATQWRDIQSRIQQASLFKENKLKKRHFPWHHWKTSRYFVCKSQSLEEQWGLSILISLHTFTHTGLLLTAIRVFQLYTLPSPHSRLQPR